MLFSIVSKLCTNVHPAGRHSRDWDAADGVNAHRRLIQRTTELNARDGLLERLIVADTLAR
jgi:hypothetical protein